MKKTILEIRQTVRSLLREATCPACGNLQAYIGLNDVKCPNPECVHYEDCPKCGGDQDDETFERELEWFDVEQTFPHAAKEWPGMGADHGKYDDFYVDESGTLHGRSIDSGEEYVWDPDGDGWVHPSRRGTKTIVGPPVKF